MTEKFKILAKYIKDMSSETPDVETFLFVTSKPHIIKFIAEVVGPVGTDKAVDPVINTVTI